MNYSFARCILLLLFLSVVAAEEEFEIQPASCASDTNPDGESCQQSPDPDPNIVDIDITIDPMEAIQKYGVAQEADGSEKEQTIERIIDSLEYMRSLKDMAHCRNAHKLCAFWSSMGECENNSFMTTQCGPSCHSCTEGGADAAHVLNDESLHELSESELLEAVKAYGEPQELGENDKLAVLDVIIDSIDYMRNLGDTLSQEIKDSCVNKHELCAYWVAIGECEANVAYMKVNCGPSCRSCAMIDFDYRCPPRDAALEPGLRPYDLDIRFQKIVDDPALKVTVHSRPDLENGTDLSQPPWVITIDDFLTSSECDKLVQLGTDEGYQRSKDVGPKKVDGSFEAMESTGRTSENAWCSNDCANDPVATVIYERIASTIQIGRDHYEDFQILRYDVGQFYKQHHDFIGHQVDRACGPRILTFYQYLSDVEEGGGTAFPDLGITVAPKKGRVLLWPSVLSSNPEKKDHRMDHEALPVIKGLKYGANAWIHLYDFKAPHLTNCT